MSTQQIWPAPIEYNQLNGLYMIVRKIHEKPEDHSTRPQYIKLYDYMNDDLSSLLKDDMEFYNYRLTKTYGFTGAIEGEVANKLVLGIQPEKPYTINFARLTFDESSLVVDAKSGRMSAEIKDESGIPGTVYVNPKTIFTENNQIIVNMNNDSPYPLEENDLVTQYTALDNFEPIKLPKLVR